MSDIKQYIEQNKQRFLDELFALLRIPSISADPAFAGDVVKAAEFVAESMRAAGADKVEVCPTAGYPIVYGEKIIDPSLPTVLVYGHYDVQPAVPLELWDTAPFEPTIKKTELHPEGAIFARGSADDKGQFYMHVKALETLIQTNTLQNNIKFCIEGEEEVGSTNLGIFVNENQNKLHEQRLAISRDLHDNIGAQLTFIISSVENLKFGFPNIDNKIKNQLTKVGDFTRETIIELRDTIWAMNSNEFAIQDLKIRLTNFIEKAKVAPIFLRVDGSA